MQFIIAAVFGAICAAIAQTRGRSAVGWFFVGLFASCIGVILVLVLPDLKVQQEREERIRRENRRLRERLRKERMVADSRHEATMNRLDVHDDALGLDTGQAASRIEGKTGPAESDHFGGANLSGDGLSGDGLSGDGLSGDGLSGDRPRAATPATDDGTEWYYLKGQQRVGPIRVPDLQELWEDRRIDDGTLVWCAAMTDWAAIRTVSKLRRVLGD